MTRSVRSSRLLLIEDRRGGVEGPAPVAPLKRYRLARLRFDGRPGESEGRFDCLKRSHD